MARVSTTPTSLTALPGAALTAVGRQMAREWRGGPVHRMLISGPRPRGLAVRPRDLRPADPAAGQRLVAGVFRFGGEAMEVGVGGDPWRRAAPSRRFAAALHGFGWMGDLLTRGEDGAREGLRLWLEWRRQFGRFNAFAWTGPALERRVFNLACAAPALLPLASEAEGAALLDGLARQARHLLADEDDPGRAAERAAVAGVAGAALAGAAGQKLLAQACVRLRRLTPEAVLRDGVHASRAPERGLELLFDLLSLDDALSQLGMPAPTEVSRAIDRLGAAARFFTLADGRLAAFHGGEAGESARVATALALEAAAAIPAKSTPYGAFHRLEGRGLEVMVDAGAPAQGAWAGTACAQPAALAVTCDGRRLIQGSAWSSQGAVGEALRRPAGGSCATLGDVRPATSDVVVERRETDEAVWLDLAHDGWRRVAGLAAARRLYLDVAAGELRGEDELAPVGRTRPGEAGLAVRFQLAPGVAASIAADGRSALVRPAGGRVWRLRGDAPSMRLEAGVAFEDGEPRATHVVVLEAFSRLGAYGRVRWKLARDEN